MATILIVDDEPENVELLERRLKRRGYAVLGANSAEAGFAAARDGRPDLILMDIKMPVLDGFDAMRMLREDPATAGIPVIALTAHAMQEDRDRAAAAGAADYETKPVDLDRLLGKIRQLTGAK